MRVMGLDNGKGRCSPDQNGDQETLPRKCRNLTLKSGHLVHFALELTTVGQSFQLL